MFETVLLCNDLKDTAKLENEGIDRLEVRLDLFEELPKATELMDLRSPLIITLRRTIDGGCFSASEVERSQIIRTYLDSRLEQTLFDVEWNSTLKELIYEYPEMNFILSYHELERTPDNLEGIFKEMLKTGVSHFKVVTKARTWSDFAQIIKILKLAEREGVTLSAFCTGPLGAATRLIALFYGSYFVYLTKGSPTVEGMFTVDQFFNIYNARRINGNTKFFGILGLPVSHSLSPHIHNFIFSRENLPYVYLYFPAEDLEDFMANLDLLNIKGLSVTLPFKMDVMKYCNYISSPAKILSAVNTITVKSDGIRGDNTDWIGVKRSVEEFMPWAGGTFLVLGAGGAARSVLYALRKRGAKYWVWNRTGERLKKVLNDFPEAMLYETGSQITVDCVINSTSVSLNQDQSLPAPLNLDDIDSRFAFDLVYNPPKSMFLKNAERKGIKPINGFSMFFYQALEQEKIWIRQTPSISKETAFSFCLPYLEK